MKKAMDIGMHYKRSNTELLINNTIIIIMLAVCN